MSTISPQIYSQWRARFHAPCALQEAGDPPPPPERLLQDIWYQQRLRRDQLQLLDGRKLRVLHPGFWNHEAGPDFRGAVLQFGSDPPISGDVEIDLETAGWRNHGHDRNPGFKNVALHVVWKGKPGPDDPLPTLAVQSWLDALLPELIAWAGNVAGPELPFALAGQCRAPLRDLAEDTVAEILRQAAQIRLQTKAAQFQARAKQAGWEQAFWEGAFRALGYKHNAWPMQTLAELLPRLMPSGPSGRPTALTLQARLLGASGLLPSDLIRAEARSDTYLRSIWDIWWRDREAFSDVILPRAVWRLHGLRPANHPQRRLALAAHWLVDGKRLSNLEKWFASPIQTAALPGSLLQILQVEHDDFWSRHWTFRSARMPKPQPLLGAQRATDLAINVVLPWIWIRAVAGKNERLQHTVEQRYFAWPKAEDNVVLRLARQRLLGPTKKPPLRTAADQQGLLQIVRDFCDHSNAICQNCPFPELVGGLRGS